MGHSVRNSRRVHVLNTIKAMSSHFSQLDRNLLFRLTTHNGYRMPYDGDTFGELFIHWWYRDRNADQLTACEIFHLNMLRYFNAMDRVETIHIRCIAESQTITHSMQEAIDILSCGKCKVDFKIASRNSRKWEHDTFKEATEYAVSSGKFVYYTHFKGVSRIGDTRLGIEPRLLRNSTDLDIYYWCYLMYLALFSAPKDVKAIGPLIHLGMNPSYRNRDIKWSNLCNGDEVFHYCGSFQAFLGTYISECLDTCNLGTIQDRLDRLWVGDPYTVEMFLSMVALKDDVYSLDVDCQATIGMYNVYRRHSIPQYVDGFQNLYI